MAMQLSWFKADVKFGCPSCGKVSTETILAHARDLSDRASRNRRPSYTNVPDVQNGLSRPRAIRDRYTGPDRRGAGKSTD